MMSPRSTNLVSATVPTKPSSAISNAASKKTLAPELDPVHQQQRHRIDVQGIECEHPILEARAAPQANQYQHEGHSQHGLGREKCEGQHPKISPIGDS